MVKIEFREDGLTLEPITVTAFVILGVALILFISDLLHIATTSVLVCLALAIFGVIPLEVAFAGFANDIVFLITGMMIVGSALIETGVSRVIGRKIISVVGSNERIFIVVVCLACLPLSAFLTNTATVAMMLPIAAAAIAASNGKFSQKNTFMMVGIASVSGGALTLVSSTPQLIAQGILRDGGFETLGFFHISIVGAPIAIFVLLYAAFVAFPLQKRILKFSKNPDTQEVSSTADEPAGADTPANDTAAETHEKESIIKMCIAAGILVFCVVAFIAGLWSPGIVAMVGAATCVVTGCISQKKVFQKLDWTSVIVIGCSFGFAAGLHYSGAAEVIAQGAVNILGEGVSPWLLCAVLVLIAAVLGNFMSNTATAALLIPIAIAIASSLNINVMHVALCVAIGANISFSTPLASPALTLTLQGGYRFKDYIILGGLFNILAYIIVLLMIPFILML